MFSGLFWLKHYFGLYGCHRQNKNDVFFVESCLFTSFIQIWNIRVKDLHIIMLQSGIAASKNRKEKKRKAFYITIWPIFSDIYMVLMNLQHVRSIFFGHCYMQTSYFKWHTNIYMCYNYIGRMRESVLEKIKKKEWVRPRLYCDCI